MTFTRYSGGFPLAGLIYCHRITDNNISKSSYLSMGMFTKIVGLGLSQKVTLLQTMWDTVNPSIGEGRDQYLRTNLWRPMIDAQAAVERFRNTPVEAWSIVSRRVALHADLIMMESGPGDPLLLQEEMVIARKRVERSSAGKELYNDYQLQLHNQLERLRMLQSTNLSPETRKDVEKQVKALDADLNKTFEGIHQFDIPFLRKLILMFTGTSK